MSDADTAGPLTILLVEDATGDARYIRELLSETDGRPLRPPARLRRPLDEDVVAPKERPPEVAHERRLDDALGRLEAGNVDVVLLDLNLPDSDGLATVEAVRGATDVVPVVVLTGLRDRELGLHALRRGADEYLVKDELQANLLGRTVYHAIERREQERQLERQRNQLAALNHLNELVHELTHLVVESSSRETIERRVCAHLVEHGPYVLAWTGDVDVDDRSVSVREAAGVDEYLDGAVVRIDDGPRGGGPTGRAVRSGEVRVARYVAENPDYEPWRERALDHGIRAGAAIPVVYEGTTYGVLNVYSSRPDAFEADERAVVGRLGEVVGHAINAIERKRALVSESVVELEFHVRGAFDGLEETSVSTEGVTFERTISLGGGQFVQYGTVTADGRDALSSLVAAFDHYRDVTVFDEDAAESRFEAHLDEPPAVSAIASVGGRIERFDVEDGTIHLVVHVPRGGNVGRVVDAVDAAYPTAELLAKRQTAVTDDPSRRLARALEEDLTEKQRSAVEAAYFAGFFEWPRDNSGEEVARSLGVSPATFHQHVRASQRKLFGELLDGEAGR